MSATKTVGFLVLIGVGVYAVYYFINRKVEAAETAAGSKIDAISAGLKSSIAGVVSSLGTGLGTLLKGKAAVGAVSAGAGAASAASKFVGPIKPVAAATAGPGVGAAAGTGGIFSGMTTAGIAGFATVAALWVYTAFNKLFPKSDPEWEAIERRLQQAKDSGEPIFTKISKAQLKAPVR